jgi:peptidoglycan/LPS O-acetylase OafA/YrhL
MATATDEMPLVVDKHLRSEVPALRMYRPDVEGLRAVAVGLVVLYHAGVTWLPGGYVGVDVFFVISGFLITSLLLREFDADGRLSLVDFYARRARRILPLASLVLIATIAGTSMFLAAGRLGAIARDGVWSAVFGANFRFASSGADYLNATAAPSPLQHFWSLAVEEQFYVVWPALLWGALTLARPGRGRNSRAAGLTGVIVGASLIWSIYETPRNANSAYFSPLTRGWELGAGALVAICAVSLSKAPRIVGALAGWLGLGLIVYSALAFDSTTQFPGKAALVPIVGTVCVIAGGLAYATGGPEIVLGLKPMQQLGKFSFALYLWHWPILVVAQQKYPNISLSTKLILVLLSVVLAAATYRLFENPIRRSPRLARSAKVSLLVGAGAVAASLLYANMYVVGDNYTVEAAQRQFDRQSAAAATTSAPATATEIESAVAAAVSVTSVPANVSPPLAIAARDLSPAYTNNCLVDAPKTVSPACTFGDPASDKTVVLFGDSHAAQWMPALQNSASRAKFKLVVLTKGNCPAPTMSVYNVELKRAFTECDQWRQWALNDIAKIKPALVIVSSTFHGVTTPDGQTQTAAVEAAWESGLTVTLDKLRTAAARVVMISDVANHTQVVPDCLSTNPTDIQLCGDPTARANLTAHETAQTLTARESGVQYLDVQPWFCTDTVCPAVINGIVTDFDDSHLTATYSSYLGHALAVELGLES